MSLEMFDLMFRFERRFAIRFDRREFFKRLERHDPPDITVGDLCEYVRIRAVRAGTLDDELDAEAIWPIFRHEISCAMGVDPNEITKGSWIFRDLDW